MSSQLRTAWPRPLHRKPQNEDKVTFKKSREFKLRDWISEEVTMQKTPCMFEMSFVFTCLKDNHFNEKECFDEVKNFRDCYIDSLKKAEQIKFRRMNPGKNFGGGEKMIAAEINAMLSKYKK